MPLTQIPKKLGKKLMKKYGKGKKTGLRRRTFKPARNVSDFASCSENQSITPPAGGNFTTNTMYSLRNIRLSQFVRAPSVAVSYQHYRIKKVTLILKPTYDTFQQAVGGPSKCRGYYMIDKAGALPNNPTLEALKQMGAKPINFDEKPIMISWRPSVLEGAYDTVTTTVLQSRYRISPWLSTPDTPITNPDSALASDIAHLGVFFYVDQLFGGGLQYTCELACEFEFKKPCVPRSSGAPVALDAVPAIRDNSPDGIVGGGDVNNIAR